MRYVLLAVALSLVIAGLPTATALDGNEPPVVDAGLDQSVEVGDTVYLDGGGSFDPDGDRLTYEWSVESPDGSTFPPEGAGSERTSFEASETGRYYVTLAATDEDGVERTDTLYVDVGPADEESEENGAPTGRISGPDAVIRGESATFSADVSDPDGSIDSYGWSTGAHGRTTERTFSEAVGERVTVSVTVTDDDGASTRLTKTATVVEDGSESTSNNDPPGASIDGPERLGVGEGATFLLRGADSDGTVVRRSWAEPEATSGSTITRSFDRSGEYTIRGTVTDDDGATATASHTVEVYGSGEPVVSISGPDTVPSGSSASYTLEAYDPDGGELTVSWSPAQTRLEREASPFDNTVPVDDPPGETLVVSATVTDDEGQSVTVVKRTKVTRVTDKVWDEASPIIDDLTFAYPPSMEERMDDRYDVHGGTYIYGVNVSHDTGERVNVRWEFNDSTTLTDALGPLDGTVNSTVEHQFMSEEGGKQTRAIWVEATDGSGDQTRRKWTHRVHTSARHDDIRFSASAGGESIGADGRLTVPVGTTVRFDAFSLQYFRVEFGDGVVEQHDGSQDWQSFQHSYDDPGTYTIQISSHQGPEGYGAKRVTIHVTGESYTEYWYEVREKMREQIISQNSPAGDSWEAISVARSERYFTGNTETYEGHLADNIELGDGWILNRTYTATRERTKTRVADFDPVDRVAHGRSRNGVSNRTRRPISRTSTPGTVRGTIGPDGRTRAKRGPRRSYTATGTTTADSVTSITNGRPVRSGRWTRHRMAGSHDRVNGGTTKETSGTLDTIIADGRSTIRSTSTIVKSNERGLSGFTST
ncbi:PKD domain-containing protein [Halorarum salinum]|uniref:PKD domain-containing protein n=1 Tax=Halorarum salinum TaxID=2743089 RepID=A0A7D5LB21_9EURY|nr:PKD domain-containing protein [Halobaculum salinum]QLG62254.1 hypothetical protein HUG12_11145 [Halobaculum salinum]